MDGRLEVELVHADGRTRVSKSRAEAPFHYLPPARTRGPACTLTIVNSSGGVLGEDRLQMIVHLGEGAHLDLCTQSATRVYRSSAGSARSIQRFQLAAGARLEYFPDEIIPFAGSAFSQETTVDLAPGATALLSEVATAGRLARGERFAFRRLAVDLACTVAGHPALRDRYDLDPVRYPVTGAAILDGRPVWGSFYWLTREAIDDSLVEAIDDAFAGIPGGCGGATRGPLGVVGRALADEVEPVHQAIARARAIVRETPR